MGDGDDGPGVILQGPLQPGHRFGVEMVGGFVEKEEVRLGQEQPAEGHPAALPAGQRRHVGVARGEPEGIHGDLEGPFEVPGPGGVDLVLELGLLGQQFVEVGVGRPHGRADVVKAVDQGFCLSDPIGDIAEHVLGGIELWFLGQMADGESRGEAGLARKAVVFAGHDLEE